METENTHTPSGPVFPELIRPVDRKPGISDQQVADLKVLARIDRAAKVEARARRRPTEMTRNIYIITRHAVAIGPFSSWRAATEAWRQDIDFWGDRSWAWNCRFEEHPPERHTTQPDREGRRLTT